MGKPSGRKWEEKERVRGGAKNETRMEEREEIENNAMTKKTMDMDNDKEMNTRSTAQTVRTVRMVAK